MKFMKNIKLSLFLSVAALMFVTCNDSGSDEPDLSNLKPRYPVQQARSVKRGVSFSFTNTNDVLLLSEGCCWAYNWGTSQSSTVGDLFDQLEMDYCPMTWNGVNAPAIRAYVQAHPNTKYLLGFNEPNLTDQANMTPAQAAAKWQEVVDLAKELDLKLLSPAMNYGTLAGYYDPIKWLDEFFNLVNINDIYGIAIHCYMPNASSVKGYIDMFKKYGKPIWMTEFCAWDGLNNANFSEQGQISYMIDIVNYMESDPMVERYAWFIPRGNYPTEKYVYQYLLSKTNPPYLLDLGVLYNAVSSQDKNVWYVENQTIEAEKYSNINCSESVGQSGLKATPTLRFTTDPQGGDLDLNNMKPEMWVEYQIDVPATGTYQFQLRYSTVIASKMDLLINGTKINSLELNRSTNPETTWVTLEQGIKLSKGKQTLRLNMTEGSLAMNWLTFSIPQ